MVSNLAKPGAREEAAAAAGDEEAGVEEDNEARVARGSYKVWEGNDTLAHSAIPTSMSVFYDRRTWYVLTNGSHVWFVRPRSSPCCVDG
jgi:hypothetical protein